MKKICITANACRRRGLDAKRIQSYFLKNGYNVVKNPKKADIIIYVACGFHGNIAESNFKRIKEFQKYNAELIVAGCLPINEKENLSKYFNGRTLGTKELNRIDSKIDELFPENKKKFWDIEDANFLFSNSKLYPLLELLLKIKLFKIFCFKFIEYSYRHIRGMNSFKSTVFPIKPLFHLRVAWGCDSKCTYCVIRKSTGPFHSKPLDQCIKEFKKGLSQGYKDFIITAVNSGCYGKDIGSSFPELLDELTKIPGDFKIIIRGLYPNWLIKYIDELEEIIKRNKIKLLGIPIQSGSPQILKLMNRRTELEKLKNACRRLQNADPNLIIDTHYIIGFPTETDEDFQHTLKLVKDIDSKVVYFFPFSSRTGTAAEKLKPKVTNKQIQLRIKKAQQFLENLGYQSNSVLKMRLPLFEKK